MTDDGVKTGLRDHLLMHFGQHAKLRDGEYPLVIARGEGVHVIDTDGRRYLDALSCLFCAQLGYSYGEEFAEAATAQLTRLPFNTNWNTAHPPAIELAERLADLAPVGINRAFFTSGGSEAVESAWKIARQYHVANGQSERVKAVARRTAYHGQTLGALALTGIPALKEPFGPPAIDVVRAPNTGEPDALAQTEAAIIAAGPETIGMLIAEPVQNAGGCFVPPAGYWTGLRELADRYGFLLVADEVITGFGRIGEYFAVPEVVPDMITIAKGLTSAYAPMGAVLVGDRVAEPFYRPGQALSHGLTFGGHPLAAAIALRNLDIFERDKILDGVRELAPHLSSRMHELEALDVVKEVRGDGFFYAAELDVDDLNPIRAGLLRAGLIARADDRGAAVVQIAPPLVCEREHLDEIVDKIGGVLGESLQKH
ncbi:aminotransferase class III-fold pyridoxal phosphate-dependent enzyme [Kutzneria buriramensis]|uniref:Adenosylmethionine-8-amino-7-oxononanoate aminotransferase n=1 Tax=Kutzneria buriramensis TaxID=1045776 RepID=A0A3E0I6A5_9PSEU|nr:aminotransferase class III-fold pyridoxal phosphate-dependent enzyme [Kutzneria buriramensis]REH54056.1 adenosylmethionine-8-amino-7-oxononanoate aminotransferase [Kutzneria buriramensis]